MIPCDGNLTKLMAAIENEEVEAASEILRSIDEKLLEPVGTIGVTAVQLAAWHGRVELLEELHRKGADVHATDKIGRCALYLAAHRGNIDVVKWLLERGSYVENRVGINYCTKEKAAFTQETSLIGKQLPLPECWGRTPLHEAVKNNHSKVVKLLVEAGANVDVEDNRKITALLLAGSTVKPDDTEELKKFVEIIEIFVSAKASMNAVHPDTGTTALHHATALGSPEATQKLLDGGAWPLFKCTNTGSTALHIAASNGYAETLRVLLKTVHPDQIDIRDEVDCTSLHRASYQSHRECVRALIDHGGNLAAKTKTGVTVIDAIFSHIPRPLLFLTDILDSRIQTTSKSVLDRDACVTVDFGVLAPKGELQMGVVNAIIEAASDVELAILQHPLVETFLRLKWSRLRVFFFLLVLVHLFFVLSLSIYAIGLVHYVTNSVFLRKVLAFCSGFILLHNMAQILMEPRHYLRQFESWLSLVYASFSLLISVAGDYIKEIRLHRSAERVNDPQHFPEWVLHSISVAILLGWMQMMLLVGRFPTWGYYALMFSTVLKNILKVLLAFVCLIVGFALSFAVLFHANDQFRDSWRAVVKTVVMMMGEYEYGDLFSDERNETGEGTFLPATSRIVFLAFVMLASMVLMNLMIGLAVNDIQGLEEEGHIRRLLKQAEFVAHLERVTSHRIFRSNWLHPRLRLLLESRRSIPTKIMFFCRESYLRKSHRGVPTKLIEALFQLASNSNFEDGSPRKRERRKIVRT